MQALSNNDTTGEVAGKNNPLPGALLPYNQNHRWYDLYSTGWDLRRNQGN
jgi:hypothetical protein